MLVVVEAQQLGLNAELQLADGTIVHHLSPATVTIFDELRDSKAPSWWEGRFRRFDGVLPKLRIAGSTPVSRSIKTDRSIK